MSGTFRHAFRHVFGHARTVIAGGLGHLASWGFYSHRSGGRFRRLETMSGADHMTLLNMQTAIYQEAQETDPFAFREFREICNSHTDYMWNNTTP